MAALQAAQIDPLISAALDAGDDIVLVLRIGAEGGSKALSVVWANGALERAIKRPVDEFLDHSPDFLWSEQPDPVQGVRLASQIASARDLRLELPVRDAKGQTVWLGLHQMPVTGADGQGYIVLLGRDITSKRREAATERATRFMLGQVFLCVEAAVMIVDARGRVLLANGRMRTLCGRPAAEVEGADFLDFTVAEDRAAIAAARERQVSGDPDGQAFVVGVRLERPDGTVLPVRVHSVMIERPDMARFRVVTLTETGPATPSGRQAAETEAAARELVSAAAPDQMVLPGKLRLIGLEEVRAALGERWAAHAAHAVQTAEEVVREQLRSGETASVTADEGILVCLIGGDEGEIALRCAAMGRLIRRRLIGEGASPAAAAVSAVTDTRPLSQADLLPKGNLLQRLEARLSARREEREAEARSALEAAFDRSRARSRPLFGPDGQATPLAVLDLAPEDRHRLLAALALLPPRETAWFDLAALRLGLAAEAMLAETADPGALRLVPIEYDALVTPARAARLTEALSAIGSGLGQRFVPLLTELPESLPRHRLTELINTLRGYAKEIAVAVDAADALPFDPDQRRVEFAVFEARPLLRDARRRDVTVHAGLRRLRLAGVRLVATETREAGEPAALAALGVELSTRSDALVRALAR